MSDDSKRKFHVFALAMQEEANLYETIQKIVEATEDRDLANKIIQEKYSADLEAAMTKSKAAWKEWQKSIIDSK